VNCARLHHMLDAYMDGELDRATKAEIAAHLAQCADCAALHRQRDGLRRALRTHAPNYHAPAALKAAVHRTLAAAQPQRSPQPRRGMLSWWQAAAFATVAALAGLIAGYWLAQPQPDLPLREPAVASHVAALSPQRQLIEIASSDRHTVKPWFQGRIDIAPPVKELFHEGYTLLGGRLDQVADRQAAAVVYQVRKHLINLYVWRAIDLKPDAITTVSVRGYSVATWAAGGLRFAAVSDVDGRDLTRFARLVSAP
jgi:anti-sigma factor RsiW